jgi:hypothetical protein
VSILTNNYFGYGYLAIVAVVLAFLSDITLNQGRVTEGLLNTFVSHPEC